MHITFTEVTTSLVLYSIVHAIYWLGSHAERITLRLIKNEVNRVTHQHVVERHEDTLLDCTENRCGEMLSASIADVVI